MAAASAAEQLAVRLATVSAPAWAERGMTYARVAAVGSEADSVTSDDAVAAAARYRAAQPDRAVAERWSGLEQAAREQAARDAALEQAAREQAARDAALEPAAQEQAEREAALEHAAQQHAARDAALERAAEEQAAREPALHERPTSRRRVRAERGRAG